jgi:tripartite-type tricarboxylate transporter receptor subunit TctC
MKAAGIEMTNVNYKGSAEVFTALLGGEIQVAVGTVSAVAPLSKSGKLVALAIAATQRSPQLPDVPTVAEAGLPYHDSGAWWGVFATGGTPKAVVDKIGADIADIINQPDVAQILQNRGFQMTKLPADQFAAFVEKDMAQDIDVMQSLGIKKQ